MVLSVQTHLAPSRAPIFSLAESHRTGFLSSTNRFFPRGHDSILNPNTAARRLLASPPPPSHRRRPLFPLRRPPSPTYDAVPRRRHQSPAAVGAPLARAHHRRPVARGRRRWSHLDVAASPRRSHRRTSPDPAGERPPSPSQFPGNARSIASVALPLPPYNANPPASLYRR